MCVGAHGSQKVSDPLSGAGVTDGPPCVCGEQTSPPCFLGEQTMSLTTEQSLSSSRLIYVSFCICWCLCGFVDVCVKACRSQKVPDALELELRKTVNCWLWVLATELRSSAVFSPLSHLLSPWKHNFLKNPPWRKDLTLRVTLRRNQDHPLKKLQEA